MIGLTEEWLFISLSFLVAFIAVFITWVKWSHGYWQRRGLCTPSPTFLLDNYFKSHNKRHGGFYLMLMPNYMPIDPEIIKNIMQNDFSHFVDRGVYSNERDDPLSAHLFSLEGAKWRNLRMKLTPTFTSGKMKMMFDILAKCGDELILEMDRNVGKSALDVKDILSRFTTDIIGSCAFGINCNSLKNPDNEFTTYLKMFFMDGFWENIVGFFSFVAPNICRTFRVKAINPVLSKFIMKVVTETVEYREKNDVQRRDFIHLLLQLKNRGKLIDDDSVLNNHDDKESHDHEVSLTLHELAAQVFVFFLAGYETSSTTLTFCLFELASQPDIQEKLRQEINDVLNRHDNKLCYNAIMEMHYMERIINETLRKYPPLPGLHRICTKQYKIPGTDIILEKGTKIFIPVLALQRDAEYYPNPELFDPERFTPEKVRERHPYTFIPFGEGPRICIGLRFGMMQTKVALTVLLQNYKFSVNSKTTLPLRFDPRSFIITTEGGIWLDYAKV